MSLTLIGFAVLAFCLRYAGDVTRLAQIVLIAGVFEAAAAVIVGGFGLQPGLVPAAFLVAAVGTRYLLGHRSAAEVPALRIMAPMLVMFAYAAVTAVLMPDVFAGRIIVWPQKFDGPEIEPVPLAPGQGNLNQVLYLAANIGLALGAALALGRAGTAWRSLVKAYLFGGYLAVAIAAWEFASRTVGVPYPKELLQSNPGWSIVEQMIGSLPRLQGPFSEPSAFGFYLAGVAFACTSLCLRGYRVMRADVLLVLVIFATFMSTSTTGIAALAIGLPCLLFGAAARGRQRELRRLLHRLALPGGAFVLLVGALLVMRPEFLDQIQDVIDATLNKTESDSFTERGAMNAAAWQAFWATGGLGVGWGSTRASSVLPGLLAGAGVVGVVTVGWLVAGLIRAVRRARRIAPAGHPALIAIDAFGASLAGLLLAAALSAPMITTPIFYCQLGVLAAAAIRISLDARLLHRLAPDLERRSNGVPPRTAIGWSPQNARRSRQPLS